MILEKICVTNFGVFRGKYDFDLSPNMKELKPIILFGGLNGSGKTTLFQGIKLCLYGQRSSKVFRTKGEYDKYLRNKIIPIGDTETKNYQGAIELSILFSDFGVVDRYLIRRSWMVESKQVDESFIILKNGEMLSEVEQEYSQAFIANLIPIGVSDLFFFDGEKIQELAEDSANNDSFKNAVYSILGLDVIETLINDLKIYSYRQSIPYTDQNILMMIEKTKEEIISQDMSLEKLRQGKLEIQSILQNIYDNIIQKENELNSQGAGYAKKRLEYKTRLNNVEGELVLTRKRLRDKYSGLFPFSLVPDLCYQLKDRIQDEHQKKREIESINFLNSKKLQFKENFLKTIAPHISINSNSNEDELIDDIFKSLNDVISVSKEDNFHFISDFSEKEISRVLFWMDQSILSIPKDIRSLMNRHNEFVSESRHYENMLRKVPDDTLLRPIVADINELYEKNGRYKNELQSLEENINLLDYNINEAKKNIELQYEELEKQNKHKRKQNLVKKILKLLSAYQEIMKNNKNDQLREAFLNAIATILHKPNFITDIQMDSETYNISLKREDGRYVDKSQLSNGEKQIYAISMILALARVSGRPLPFIIDTPLARLDSAHRDNVVSNFFPNASHQVIIFSTDTEIDNSYFEKLTPYISRVYHLKYDSSSSSTEIEEGYFWKEPELMNY